MERTREPFQWGANNLFVVVMHCIQTSLLNSADVARVAQLLKKSQLRNKVRHEFQEKQVKEAERVYAVFRRLPSTGVEGVAGSLTARNMVKIFSFLPEGISGKSFFDAGAGPGKIMLVSKVLGSISSSGYDLGANLEVYARLHDAAKKELGMNDDTVNLGFGDLTKLEKIPAAHMVYAYWDSMAADARDNLLKVVKRTGSVEMLACTNAQGETIDLVESTLNEDCLAGRSWKLVATFAANAEGGTMQRQVWIFRRPPQLPQANPCTAIDFPSDFAVNLLLSGPEGNLRPREARSARFSPLEFLPAAEELAAQGFGCFKLVGRGGFGFVVRSIWKDRPCVIKLSFRPSPSDESKKNDSLFREYEILLRAARNLPRHPILPKPAYWIKGSALATMNLRPDRCVSLLCMDACYSDCLDLKKRFQEETRRTGVLSPECRLFFRSLLQVVWLAHTTVKIAHRDLKWANLLLRNEWKDGTDPDLVLADTGISFLETENRQYVGDDLEVSRNLASFRAKKISETALKAQLLPKTLLEPVSVKSLQNTMCSEGKCHHTLKSLSMGTVGYRPPDSDPEIVERKKKKKVPDFSFEYGQAHDVYSVAAMMLEIHQDKNGAEWASSKCPASAWEKSLHKLESTQDIMNFIRASSSLDSESIDYQNLILETRLLQGMLRKDFKLRYPAEKAGKHDFLTMVFLAKEQEALAAAEGIPQQGGVPPWANGLSGSVRRVGLTPVPELRIKRLSGKKGFGVFCTNRARPGELLTYYAGRTCENGKYLFSKHVYPIQTNHCYVDGFYGSGAWKVERITEERSVGSVINSSRIESGVHSSGNCIVQ